MVTLLQTAPAPAPYLPNDLRPSLMGLTREELADMLGRIGVPEKQRRMRARQIWRWIYHRGALNFEAMTDISKASAPNWKKPSPLEGRTCLPSRNPATARANGC